MPNYITNAFSLNMLNRQEATLEVVPMSPRSVQRELDEEGDYVSFVGHADTAALFSAQLGREIAFNRGTFTLTEGDHLLVGQYSGPRLPEGACTLPEGAEIQWYWILVMTE